MNTDSRSAPTMSLAGREGWLITDDKMGHRVQARGVAEALGLRIVEKVVRPKGVRKWLAPWAGVARAEAFGQPDGAFAPPWPAIAIATGRTAIPYIRALKSLAGPSCFTVILQDPRCGTETADLIWVPEHDRLRSDNVVTTPTSPHTYSPARLVELRRACPPEIASLPRPRVAVMLGGPNSAYAYAPDDQLRLAACLAAIAAKGASFLITPSRRSPEALVNAVDAATREAPRVLWRGGGDNPYADFLAHADVFVITADSVNMAGEASATGRPVHIFTPKGRAGKFGRFHANLRRAGITRELDETSDVSEVWSYDAPQAAEVIAEHIRARWQCRTTQRSGLAQTRVDET